MSTFVLRRSGAFLLTALLLACARKEARPVAEAEISAPPPDVGRIEPDGASSEGNRLWEPRWKRTPDVVYVPTPQPVVDRMLAMAKVTERDVVYDLGCGDGRILVTAAARYGARGFGIDLDPDRVEEARENARRNGVAHLVTIEEGDAFEVDLRPATVVTLYLLPDLNHRLLPALRQLRDGARVVTHDYGIEGVDFVTDWMWEPTDPEERAHFVYLYELPFGD